VIERLSIQSSEKLEKVSGLDKRQTEKRETDRQATEKQAGEKQQATGKRQRQETETEKRQEVGGGEQRAAELSSAVRLHARTSAAEHAEMSSDSHARCRAASTKQPR